MVSFPLEVIILDLLLLSLPLEIMLGTMLGMFLFNSKILEKEVVLGLAVLLLDLRIFSFLCSKRSVLSSFWSAFSAFELATTGYLGSIIPAN